MRRIAVPLEDAPRQRPKPKTHAPVAALADHPAADRADASAEAAAGDDDFDPDAIILEAFGLDDAGGPDEEDVNAEEVQEHDQAASLGLLAKGAASKASASVEASADAGSAFGEAPELDDHYILEELIAEAEMLDPPSLEAIFEESLEAAETNRAYDEWVAAASYSDEVMHVAIEDRRTTDISAVAAVGRLSVVTTWKGGSSDTILVNWINASTRVGHKVRERNSEILCALPGIRPEERTRCFPETMEVILADARCIMRRQRSDRPRVPDDVMHLMTMCKVAEQYRQGLSGEMRPCFVCGDAADDTRPDLARRAW